LALVIVGSVYLRIIDSSGFLVGRDDRHPLPSVRLSKPIPTVVDGPTVTIAGTTSAAFVQVAVDRYDTPSDLSPIINGTFARDVDIGGLGSHILRIQTLGPDLGRPIETLTSRVARVPAVLPAPRIIAVQRTRDPLSFRVGIARPAGALVEADGGVLSEGGQSPTPDWGHVELNFRMDRPDSAVKFRARVPALGMTSEPTLVVDLAALADAAAAPSPEDRTDVLVEYVISRQSVTRTRTVTLHPNRPELADLLEGTLDGESFIERTLGHSGLGPTSAKCGLQRLGSVRVEEEITGDTATVTVTDALPALTQAWNGLTDRPEITLCFQDGLPKFGSTGRLELEVRDFELLGTVPRADAIRVERSDKGEVLRRVHVWNRVPPPDTVTLTLGIDFAAWLGLLPGARVGDLVANSKTANDITTFYYAILQALAVLLLLWLIATRPARALLPPEPRNTAAHVLTVGAGLALLPAVVTAADVLGTRLFGSIVETIMENNRTVALAPVDAARGTLIVVSLLLAGVLAFLFRRRGNELLARTLASVALAAIFVAGTAVVATVATRLTEPMGEVFGPRLSVWITATIACFLAALYGARQIGRLWNGHPYRLWAATTGWILLIAVIVAVPAGVDRTPSEFGGSTSFIESSLRSFASLLAYAYGIFGFATIVLLVRRTWGSWTWERLFRERAPEGAPEPPVRLLRRIGRFVFAGFGVGTAGVFASLPIPFVLAFAFFERVLLRSDADLQRLADESPELRRQRSELVTEAIAPPTPPAGDASPVPEEPDEKPGPAEIGPESTIWDTIRSALWAGTWPTIALTLVYFAQYDLTTIIRVDPYFFQRPALDLASFAASWLILAFLFGLLYEHLRGTSGVQKGVRLGLAILVFTVPFQVVTVVAGNLAPATVTVRVLQVVAFTVVLGATFDLALLREAGKLRWSRPRELIQNLGAMSDIRDVAAGALPLITAVVVTAGSLVTGQLTQVVTRVLTPFLPLPPGAGQ